MTKDITEDMLMEMTTLCMDPINSAIER